MQPLRLLIVVQPRLNPSSDSPAPAQVPAPSEPTIKWLEICYGDPTIQDLSDTLESRFLQRNNAPLNIKILKFLDDVELYPSYRLREIFEDIKDAKDRDKSFSTVKVYRNPPTPSELADPRRYDSLPPESLARPQKRPYSCLPPPTPPPLPPPFADTVRTGFKDTLDGPGPWFDQLIDASNKKRKVRPYSANAYVHTSDQVLDSLETTDDCQNFVPSVPHYPSSGPQVEDSQTSIQKKRSNPYYTPTSSLISQREEGNSRDDEVNSVPDSPTGVLAEVDSRVPTFTAPECPMSDSPELPSSHEPFLQSRGVPASAQISAQPSQPPIPHPASDVVQEQVSAQPQAKFNADSRKAPDLSSKSRGIRAGAELSSLSTQHDQQLPANSQTIVHEPLPDVPTALCNTSQELSVAQPQSPAKISKPPPSDGKGEAGRKGRLQRPKSLQSPRASKGTRRIINGVRAKTPSLTGPFDPIETSEGSAQERGYLQSAKRSKTTAPQRISKKAAVQPIAKSLSPVGRFLLPKISQPVSLSPARSEVSRNDGTVDASRNPNATAACEPGALEDDGKYQAEAAGSPYLAVAEAAIPKTMRHDNNIMARENLAKRSPTSSESSCVPSLHEGTSHNTEHSLSTQQDPVLAHESSAEIKVGSTPTSIDDLGVEVLEQQLKELQTARDQAQAEFDRITAQKKRGQESLSSKTAPMSSHTPGAQVANEEQNPALLAMSDEGLRIFRGDDFQAKRKHAEEELIPARNQFWRNVLAVQSARIREERETEAAQKKKEMEALAKKKRQARLVREHENKEERMAIAKRLDKERRRGEEKKSGKDARIEQDKSAAVEGTQDVRRTEEKAVQEDQLVRQTERKEKTSKQSPAKSAELEDPKAQQHDDDTPLQDQLGGTTVDANSHEGKKSIPPSGQSTRPINQFSLAERSPKARRNAALQVQLANGLLNLKQSKKDSTVATNDLALLMSNTLKSTAYASHSVHDTDSKQSAQKTRSDELQSNTERNAGAKIVDPMALKAAGYGLSGAAPSSATKSEMPVAAVAAVKTPVPDVTPEGVSIIRQDPKTPSSSPALSRDDPSRGWTMTPAIPTPSMKSNPESAEVKAARRAASAGKTSMRSALRLTPGASQRSVSFADDPTPSLLARPHEIHDAKSTPSFSNGKKDRLYQRAEEPEAREEKTATAGSTRRRSALNRVGNSEMKTATNKTSTEAKQTKMTQHVHVDRKLKGKAIDPSSPIRIPVEEQIIISSASEASTYYSDESEQERNARPGPSSRKKAKARTSSSMSASANAGVQAKSNSIASSKPESRTAIVSAGVDTHGRSQPLYLATKSSRAVKSPKMTLVQMDGARSSQSAGSPHLQSGSQPSSSMSTDDVCHLPAAAADSEQGRPGPHAGGNKVDEARTMTFSDEDVELKASRVGDEERLQREAAEQLQREHMQALENKSTHPRPSRNIRQASQTTILAVRPENEKHGGRVRANPMSDRISLSQLRKEQVAKELRMGRGVKSADVPKRIAPPSMESSSESESDSESSSGSIENSDEQKVFAPKSRKKNRLPRVYKDLFGR
ncbi:MAG: hypothetical protein Q9182_007223 [Xanthomendoza sp. 2 TL-2023]